MGIVGDEFMKRYVACKGIAACSELKLLINRSWYSVFDYGNMAVGFAKAV